MKAIVTVLLIPLWTLPALAQRLPPTNPVQPRMDIAPSPFEMRAPWEYEPPDTQYEDERRELRELQRDLDRRSCRAYGTRCDDDE